MGGGTGVGAGVGTGVGTGVGGGGGEVGGHTGRCANQVRFGKLAFLRQNGAFLNQKNANFRPFCTTFSVKNRHIGSLDTVHIFAFLESR